jgi:hypothetical protein
MAAAKQGVYAIEVDPRQLKDLLGTLRALDKETQDEVRTRAQGLSVRLAGQLMMYANAAPSPQTKLLSTPKAIKTPRDRLIRVDIGGSVKVGRKYGGQKNSRGQKTKQNQAPAGALLWGTEYGSHPGIDSIGRPYTDRFKVGSNPKGYWIAPAVDYYVPIVAKEYAEMIQEVAKRGGVA